MAFLMPSSVPHVAPEVSQLDFNNSLTLSGFNVPSVVTRRAATTVGLRNGEYLVIGGEYLVRRVMCTV